VEQRSASVCGLSDSERSERARRWRRLEPLIHGARRCPSGFRVTFGRAALAEVQSLVEAERRCCGWADWNVDSTTEGAQLVVTGSPEDLAVLAEAFGL
jgi:hypothetical protein